MKREEHFALLFQDLNQPVVNRRGQRLGVHAFVNLNCFLGGIAYNVAVVTPSQVVVEVRPRALVQSPI